MCEYWKKFSFQSPENIKEAIKETFSKNLSLWWWDKAEERGLHGLIALYSTSGSWLLHEV